MYGRMTMADVRAVPWNGLTAVGSFSGCGGASLGLRMAGWRVAAAIEFVPEAARTYRANFPDTHVFEQDIRTLDPRDVLRVAGKDVGELDLFEGSPPCASFSSAGMRERGWGTEKRYSDVRQQTDDLFDHYVRMIEGMRPRAFLAENVPGMEMGDALEYKQRAGNALAALGYSVRAEVVNAAAFGVPQERRRLIFIGLRRDVGVEAEVPMTAGEDAQRYTLRQALESVAPDDPDHAPFLAESSMVGKAVGRTWEAERGLRAWDDCARCGVKLGQHVREEEFVGAVKKAAVADAPPTLFEMEAEGGRKREAFFCADGERALETKAYFLLRVPKLDAPCPTLTATGAQSGAASVTHPTECRKFTPAEAKAICGFPPDFILTGSREQRYERMGRAVPPPIYAVIGRWIAGALRAH